MFGMARKPASCSTGWCVGPSSPKPIEPGVKIKMGGSLHRRGEPHARLHIVAEIEEGRAKRAQPRHVHAIDDRAHAVFAHPEMQVASFIFARKEVARSFKGQ